MNFSAGLPPKREQISPVDQPAQCVYQSLYRLLVPNKHFLSQWLKPPGKKLGGYPFAKSKYQHGLPTFATQLKKYETGTNTTGKE
jgi:hypothetical protein